MNPTPHGWAPCPTGELQRLAERLSFRRRLYTAATVAGVVLFASAALAGVWGVYSLVSAGPRPVEAEVAPCHDDQCLPLAPEK